MLAAVLRLQLLIAHSVHIMRPQALQIKCCMEYVQVDRTPFIVMLLDPGAIGCIEVYSISSDHLHHGRAMILLVLNPVAVANFILNINVYRAVTIKNKQKNEN